MRRLGRDASAPPLPQRIVDQFVDGVAYATTEVFDVEPPYRPDCLLVPLHVQAEVRRNLVLPCDDVVLAGFDGTAAARTLVDDDGRLGHRHHSLYPLARTRNPVVGRAILSHSRAWCPNDLSRIGTRWMIGVRETEA